MITNNYNYTIIMKKSLLMKTMLLLCALMVGSMNGWAVDDPNWSYTVVNGDLSKLNTSEKTFTVDASHVWSYEGTTVAAGSPEVTVAKSTNYGLKFGNSGSAYFSPVILSTSAFSDKAITKVRLYLKHNGKKVGNLTVKQGSTTIGTATTANTSDWISVTCSDTKKGAGGTLTIQYEVAQALLINKIEVWYEDLGTATTTTIDASGITNTDIYTSTAAGSLSASVTEKVGGASVGGATVTWTSSNEAIATVASDGTVTLKRKGSTTITASYAGDATYAASSAEYVLTVTNSAPQETDVIATTNYEWLGVADKGSITGSKDIDCEGVTVTIDPGDGTKTRGDDTYIRVYAKNAMTFTAPTNYRIYEIVFTKANNKWDNSFNVDAGTWDNTDLKWTGIAQEVTLTEAGSSGNNQFSQMEIKLVASKDVAISISDAGLATFASDVALDFTDVTGVEAYIAKENEGVITLTKVNKVPAGTGVLLRSTIGAVAEDVPVAATTDDVTGNIFVRGNDAAVATSADGKYNWILSKKSGVVGFYRANGNNVAKNRAYLQTVAAEARINLNFDDEDATAIEAVKTQNVENGQYFNLAGQRVAQPTKGLYIVNGKKVIIK